MHGGASGIFLQITALKVIEQKHLAFSYSLLIQKGEHSSPFFNEQQLFSIIHFILFSKRTDHPIPELLRDFFLKGRRGMY